MQSCLCCTEAQRGLITYPSSHSAYSGLLGTLVAPEFVLLSMLCKISYSIYLCLLAALAWMMLSFSVPGVCGGFSWQPDNPILRVTGHIRAYFDRQGIYYSSLWTDDWPWGILGGIICQLCKTASHNSPSYIKNKLSLCPGNVVDMKLLFFLP